MEIKEIKISELKDYINNPRNNDKAVESVANSIKEFGFKVPIIIDKDNVIVCGHTRKKAAERLGLEVVPCIIADDLTEDQINAFRLADNKTAEMAEWDFIKLEKELANIDIDMLAFGFNDTDFNIEPVEATEDDFDVEEELGEETEPTSKLGDIYQLGEHRLMCGDSTDNETIEKLMNGAKADLVFTDPPYGMKKEKDGVLNDNLNYDDLLEFNKKWIPLTFDALKDNGSWYCWGIDEPLMDIYSNILKPMIKDNKITFRNLITWFKNPSGCGDGQNNPLARSYGIITEKCIFVMCGVQGFNTNADQYWEEYESIRKYLLKQRNICGWDIPNMKTIAGHSDKNRDHWTSKSQWNLVTEDVYLKFQKWAKENSVKAFEKPYEKLRAEYEKLRAKYEKLRAYFDNTHDLMTEVWQFDRTDNEERELAGGHATPKPIALCSRAIKSSSREGEIVLDVFGGSGSTLIACEQLNRKCYIMELDPKYVDVIIKRWETLTGKKAVKL